MSVKVSCTESERVDISIEEYNELVRASEKIATVERFIAANDYVCTKDIMAILDIKEKVKNNAVQE